MAARELLAGLDVGTTSVKALLVTPEGEEVAIGRTPTTWTTTEFGAETSAESLVDAARQALATALVQVPEDRVVALGVASMAESGVLVGADDAPVTPVIAWHDHRDEQQLTDLVATLGAERFSVTTGLPIWTQWSLTKHRWLVDNVPDARDAKRRYNIAEWVTRSLGGDPATELSLASRTGWLELATGRPWSESLAWSRASENLMFDLVSAGTPMGTARTEGRLAAVDGATLTVAGHDHQAAVVGVGSTGPGDEFDSCGTAEAILRTIEPGPGPRSDRRPDGRGRDRRMARHPRPLVPPRGDPGRSRPRSRPGSARVSTVRVSPTSTRPPSPQRTTPRCCTSPRAATSPSFRLPTRARCGAPQRVR